MTPKKTHKPTPKKTPKTAPKKTPMPVPVAVEEQPPRAQFPAVGDTFPDGRPRWVYEAGLEGFGRFRIPHAVTEGMCVASWAAAEGHRMQWLSGQAAGYVGHLPSKPLVRAYEAVWGDIVASYGFAVPIGYVGTYANVSYDGHRGRKS